MSYQRGDIIGRRKGIVLHKGVYLGSDRVLHNTTGRGEHVSSLADFAAGKRVVLVRAACDESRRRASAATPRADRGYNLFTHNCEHTASRVTLGRSESPQLRGWVAGVGVAALAFVVTRHPGMTAAAFALGRRLVEGAATRA
ncbi:MAG: hypothetical protein ACKOBM_06235 [Gammaproteobacteria bacterium]